MWGGLKLPEEKVGLERWDDFRTLEWVSVEGMGNNLTRSWRGFINGSFSFLFM
jgi:hypothetical protein